MTKQKSCNTLRPALSLFTEVTLKRMRHLMKYSYLMTFILSISFLSVQLAALKTGPMWLQFAHTCL